MYKRTNIMYKIFICLLAMLMSITCLSVKEPRAATVKYAKTKNYKNFTVGKHKYLSTTSKKGPSLYYIKNGKRIKLLSHQNQYSFAIEVKAEYGNWLYYSVFIDGGYCDLYRYNLKSKKRNLVRRQVRHMLIKDGKLYTNGFATDVSSVPIYISNPDGKKAKKITNKSDQARMKIYGNYLYYLENTYNKNYTKVTQILVCRDLNGKNRKVLSGKITNPNTVIFFNNKYIIYENYKSEKYYKLDFKTKKKKRIYPSAKQIDAWYAVYY